MRIRPSLIPLLLLWLALAPLRAGAEQSVSYVGPTEILLFKADSVYLVRALEWNSAYVRDQEKLLLHGVRMNFWRDHLPPDMRRVYDALGYPTGRLLLTPVGHDEEWWYYGSLNPPLRFRDGSLLDEERFDLARKH